MLIAILSLLQPALSHAAPFDVHFGQYKVLAQKRTLNGKEDKFSGGTGTLQIYEKIGEDGVRTIVYLHHGKKGGWSGGGPLLPLQAAGKCVEKTDYLACPLQNGTLTTTMAELSDGRIVMSVFSVGADFFWKEIWELRHP